MSFAAPLLMSLLIRPRWDDGWRYTLVDLDSMRHEESF